MTELPNANGDGSIEVVPVVVLSQTFPARPSWIPEIRDFVRRCLAESPLNEEGTRGVSETVFRALLDAAGPTGAIQVSFRIFPEHVEVDVLHSNQPPAEVASPGEVERPGRLERGRRTPRAAPHASCPPGWPLRASPPSTRHRRRNALRTPAGRRLSTHQADIDLRPEFESRLYDPSLTTHLKVKTSVRSFHQINSPLEVCEWHPASA